MAPRATVEEIAEFEHRFFVLGQSHKMAAEAVGKTESWGRKTAARIPVKGKYLPDDGDGFDIHAGPKRLDELRDIDRRALDDFGLFRARFFGRLSLPWGEQAAYEIEERLVSSQKEYVVLNVCPGSGKTTLLHDICVWQTVKRRGIRSIWGSSTHSLATNGTRRLRATLDRTTPLRAKDMDREHGYAKDAEAILADAYGRFKPVQGLWRAEMFTVWQHGEDVGDDKEASWQAYGQDSEQLGTRVDLIVWDDLVTRKTLTNQDIIEAQQWWYDNEAETRLEPAGLLVLCGQRLAANDLYRYCLDKLVDLDTEVELDDEMEQRLAESRRHQYHHIVFRAHDDEGCEGHNKGTKQEPWPNGCLLDPYRLPWRQVLTEKRDPHRWEVVFQQNDTAGVNTLVQRQWIDGGFDPKTRVEHPGCWDKDRAILELPDPEKWPGKIISYVSVDPSVSNWWGFLWWVYHPASQQRFLIDIKRVKMLAGGFLQEGPNGEFEGIVPEWQRRSAAMEAPITRWVVEANAAHKYLTGYGFVQRFEREHRTKFISHTTGSNKADPKYGIGTLGALYQHGLKRLPGLSKQTVKPLINELLAYPDSATSDLVMADWIGEFNLQYVIASEAFVPYVRKKGIGRRLAGHFAGIAS